MALVRAPNQFLPHSSGGPVTPTCGGCCCCCSCLGTVAAASLALPILVTRMAPPSRSMYIPPQGYAPAGPPPGHPPPPVPGRNPSQSAVALAAVAIPVGGTVTLSALAFELPGYGRILLGLAVATMLALFGFGRAGIPLRKAIIPVAAIVTLTAALVPGESFLWLYGFEGSPVVKTLTPFAIIGFPLLTTFLITRFAHRRDPAPPQA